MIAIAAALGMAGARPVAAQYPTRHVVVIHRHHAMPVLAFRISERRARALALTQFPRGYVRSVHMSRRFGRPVYTYTLVRRNFRGYQLVTIDGITGRVLRSRFVRT
jgi:hypothetical protein